MLLAARDLECDFCMDYGATYFYISMPIAIIIAHPADVVIKYVDMHRGGEIRFSKGKLCSSVPNLIWLIMNGKYNGVPLLDISEDPPPRDFNKAAPENYYSLRHTWCIGKSINCPLLLLRTSANGDECHAIL